MIEKISYEIALRKVDLVEKVTSVKTLLENILKIFTKLFDVGTFTKEIQHSIMRLQDEMKALGTTMTNTKGDTR